MSTFHRLIVISLLAISVAGSALADSSQIPEPSQTLIPEIAQSPVPEPSSIATSKISPALSNSQAYYVGECKKFITQELYEPALFSCYNAYQLGSTDMGAVLYQLGKNNFFDEQTSNNLKQEYKAHKGSPEVQRLLLNIKFSSQNNYIAQGSIYGSWCFDEDMNLDAEGSSYEGTSYEGISYDGYERLVINPTGQYINASAKVEKGTYQYRNNILSLGYPNYSEYQVSLIDNNQLILKAKGVSDQGMEKPQEKDKSYSRKACSKLGMQRFIQELVNYKSTTNCDDISNYLGNQLIPAQYLPTAILNKLKQDPERYDCPQLIKKVSEAYEHLESTSMSKAVRVRNTAII